MGPHDGRAGLQIRRQGHAIGQMFLECPNPGGQVPPLRIGDMDFRAQAGVASPRVFGSVSTATNTVHSDVDLFVEPLPGATGLDLLRLEQALSEAFGVNFDGYPVPGQKARCDSRAKSVRIARHHRTLPGMKKPPHPGFSRVWRCLVWWSWREFPATHASQATLSPS